VGLAAKRPKKFYSEQPRTASLMWMYESDNALFHAVQRRLDSFTLELDKLKLAIDSAPVTLRLLEKFAPILGSVMDQASWQVCAASFLKYDKNVNLVTLWDPAAHRIHNDWKLSAGDAQ
jgi:hypothetical protein